MDRNNIIGFILIGLVLMIWMWYNTPKPSDVKQLHRDTTIVKKETPASEERVTQEPEIKFQTPQEKYGKYFSSRASGKEKIITIETDFYTAEVTSKGGLIRKWELKNYKAWDFKKNVQLIEFENGGDFSLLFNASDGKQINTRDLYFESNYQSWDKIELQNESTYRLVLKLNADGGGYIEKTLLFKNQQYSITADYKFVQMEPIIANFEYQVIWENGLRYAEHNSVDESHSAKAFAYSGGELAEIDASSDEPVKNNINGTTQWVATRNKYFGVAIISNDGKSDGAYMEGIHRKMPNLGQKEIYNIALKMPFRGGKDSESSFTLFLGPLEFDALKSYNVGLDQIMSLGWWIIRPISEYFMIPLFGFLMSFIPNFGVVIIIFSIIIKLLLHPLSKSSMKSMQKMQQLQPIIEEVKAKHKDDPQKMNQAVMKLYKEYGVNPAGGCLPMLLQLPILYALWAVFSSSIQLRQASFVWWITDLSIPDVIVTLPFAIPIFNITDVSGLALMMGITMFIQQKMTIKDPRQKMMVWMMPIFLTLLFNFFPSGLNLYYFMFNLLSIVQQKYVTQKHKDEPLRKVDPQKKSGGIINKLTKNMPKLNK
jgi:YidC/Oxa1 family membrane protein insertase